MRSQLIGTEVPCPTCKKQFVVSESPNPKPPPNPTPTVIPPPPPLQTYKRKTQKSEDSNQPSQSHFGEFGSWARVALIAATVLFLGAGAAKFLSTEVPSFTDFVPGAVFGCTFVVFELFQFFLDTLPQYTLPTAVAITAFFSSVVVLFFALYDKDASRQSVLAGFGGSLLGFATGIPFGQLRVVRDATTQSNTQNE